MKRFYLYLTVVCVMALGCESPEADWELAVDEDGLAGGARQRCPDPKAANVEYASFDLRECQLIALWCDDGRGFSNDCGCGCIYPDEPPVDVKKCTEKECGPMPAAPAYLCDDGSLGGNVGICEPTADGVCAWLFRECPDTTDKCTEKECGPMPAAPAYLCDDGSLGGNVGICEPTADGVCAWLFRECPDTTDKCTEKECGPMPAAPAYLCDDGSLGGNVGICEPTADGVCAWLFRECPDTTDKCTG